MAYDFPASPTVGQVANGYSWNGTTWERVFPGGYVKTDGSAAFSGKQTFAAADASRASLRIQQATATPTTPAVGDVLLSADGHLYHHHGGVWHGAVKTTGDTMTGQLIIAQANTTRSGLRIPQATANPTTPTAGDIAHNTDGAMYWHTGAAWRRFLYDGDTVAAAMTFTASGIPITVKNASFGGVRLYSNLAAGGVIELINSAGTALGNISVDGTFLNFISANSRGILINNAGGGSNYWLTGTPGILNLRGHATIARISFENSAASAGGYIKYDWNGSPVIGLLLSNLNGYFWQLREDGFLVTNGSISANTVSANNFYGVYNPPSDQRLKDVRGPFTMGLKELLELELVEFSYKPETGLPTTPRAGVIAQAAEKTSLGPMLVNDVPEQMIGGEVMKGIKNVNPDVLIMALINAVRTLEARVAELEAKG